MTRLLRSVNIILSIKIDRIIENDLFALIDIKIYNSSFFFKREKRFRRL